jgi:hypothetical protein
MTLIELIKSKSPRENSTIVELIAAIEAEQKIIDKILYVYSGEAVSTNAIEGNIKHKSYESDMHVVEASSDIEQMEMSLDILQDEIFKGELDGSS